MCSSSVSKEDVVFPRLCYGELLCSKACSQRSQACHQCSPVCPMSSPALRDVPHPTAFTHSVLLFPSSWIPVTLKDSRSVLLVSDTLLKLTHLRLHCTSSQILLETSSDSNKFCWCSSLEVSKWSHNSQTRHGWLCKAKVILHTVTTQLHVKGRWKDSCGTVPNEANWSRLLRDGQFTSGQGCCSIDRVAIIFARVHAAFTDSNPSGVRLKDIKTAFPSIAKERLVNEMKAKHMDGNITWYTGRFLSERMVEIKIEGNAMLRYQARDRGPAGPTFVTEPIWDLYLVTDLVGQIVPFSQRTLVGAWPQLAGNS